MRTRAKPQSIRLRPIHNSKSAIRNREEPCSAADNGESAARYLFKLSHDVILSLDRVGNILCINQRGVQLSGYSESELRGANLFELLLVPEDRGVARQMLADLVKGKARTYELRWRTKDGALVHFDGASVPRLSAAGQFLSTLCTLRDVTERKCAEEKLRKSEEKYRDLIEISPDAIYVVDPNGICVLGNRAGAELAGVPQDQLVRTPIAETYLPEERHLFRERLEKLKTGRTIRFERKFLRKNGEIVPVEVSVSGIRGGYFQAILRDISQRKRAEALLAGEKRLLEMIATGVPLKQILNALCLIIEEQRPETLASVLLLNADGVHLDVAAGPNLPKEWTRQMELMPIGPCAGSCGTAAYRGSPVIVSNIETDPLWDVPEHRAAALNHGLRASWSNPILSSEGKVLGTFCIYSREMRSPSAHDLGVMEKATHIARVAIERDRAEAAVRTSEEKYRDLINASPDAICVIDADAKYVLVNPAGVKLAGRSEEELIGSSIADTYLPEERYLLVDRLDKLKAEGSFRFERKFLRENGEVIPVEVSLSALRGRYYQAIIRDISQRKRQEALLAGENRVLAMVTKGDSLADILDSLCLLMEEQSSGVLASILLMDPNGKQLRHGGAPNLPKTYTEAIDGAFIGPAVGSCGTAAYRAEQVIVSNIATDPLWDAFRDLALSHSLLACWSTPIFSSEGKVIGTFAMYYREPRSPSPLEQDTIKHITHLAGIAVQRKLAEQALRASEQVARGQVEALAQSLDVLTT